MPNKFTLLIFITGLTLGLLIAKSSNLSPSLPSANQESQNKLDDLKNKFQKISEEDIQEYLHLKDMKTKYEKADEIFGKILNIFLLDLGLKLSAKQIEDLKASSGTSTEDKQPVLMGSLRKLNPESPTPEIQAAQNKEYVDTRNLESNEHISKLLKEKNLTNPLATWGSAKPVSRNVFYLINGRFTGNIFFLDPNKTSLDLEMELNNASFEKGQIIGEFLLKTTDPSNSKYRDITRFNPNSKIPNFRLADDGAILVEAMGGDGIFQLYYFAQTNSFQGNLYEKRGLDSFKHTGSISLNRR